MTTTPLSEADFVWAFETALCKSVDLTISDWILQWPDPQTRDSITCSLLRCASEHRKFDLAWLNKQLSDPEVLLTVHAQKQLLSDVFVDQAQSATKPTWDAYQQFGVSAKDLNLRCPEDRCYLGQTLGNRYILQTRLASGGLGTVYQSLDQDSQAKVAIKVPLRVPPDLDDLLAQKIHDEAQILRALTLPGIPRFIDLLEIAEGPVLVTELIDGVILQSLVPPDGLSEDEALLLTSKVACIADDVHQAGFVHGDIKANNVMVSDNGEVTLVDFNVSRLDDPAQMQEGFPGGTLPAMSPEAIVGVASDVDLRQDVYALGTLLHFCISSQELFVSKNREEAIVKSILLSGVHEPEFPEGTSELVRKICLAAISRQPASRFETAGDFAATCKLILSKTDETIEIPPQRTRLTAWRLGCALGMMLVRQRRVSTAFEDMESINPDLGNRNSLATTLGYAIGVTTMLEEVQILAGQLGERVDNWQGTNEYTNAFYRQQKLQAADLEDLAAIVNEGERWCMDLLGGLQTALIERVPAAAAFFMAATQAQMAPYSEDAAKRWLQCAELLPVPAAEIEDFRSRCQVYAGHDGLLSAVRQLDYQMVRWLRWESPEACSTKETGGV